MMAIRFGDAGVKGMNQDIVVDVDTVWLIVGIVILIVVIRVCIHAIIVAMDDFSARRERRDIAESAAKLEKEKAARERAQTL